MILWRSSRHRAWINLILCVLFYMLASSAFGERVAKSVNGVVTRYLVEDDVNPTGIPQVFDELNGADQVTRSYAYGLQRIDEEQVLNGSWTPSFYGYDGGGNVRQLTDSNGNPTDTYEYDAYGNSFTKSGATPNNFLYRGEQYDPDLGLYYLRARYYNPASGRFYSRDPKDGHRKNPQSLHKYLYTNGDPVNGIDPRGREDLVECAEVSAAGGCAALPATVGVPTTMVTAEAEEEVVIAESELEDTEILEKEETECNSAIEWPADDGFVPGTKEKFVLNAGEIIDRFGEASGKFAAPLGTPFGERSLIYGFEGAIYTIYGVVKPIVVDQGLTLPWFGQDGGGIQYKLPKSCKALLDEGILEVMEQ